MPANERYELELVGEQGINVKTTNFDPAQSKVTMMVWSDDDDEETWAPYPRDHDLWNKDKKRFVQVINFTVFHCNQKYIKIRRINYILKDEIMMTL